ncbi:hypothetical protein [Halobellus litoreus]|uniref:Halobacterial output domain-containing protein n=1 Tax=Halobellus litoreus TaxID=755310 RepID=A0ABD6DVT0_9EURY|nr:hypothetical protein [Halobellus litoreus]
MPDDDPPRPANLPPGFDEESPYTEAELEAFPEWWRRNVEEFRDHEMRPYRPPRLADGTVTTELVDRLESAYGVDIRIRAVDPHDGGAWEILVDDEVVRSVERTRTEAGNTRYEITERGFEAAVTDAVTE